ncbi:hypothetical protein SY88_15990 [Clostridiales bacterium PH28_bin88]|nr:hypothetical protein SY88_15990 [Clostridiales bacterium PH28_bin88]
MARYALVSSVGLITLHIQEGTTLGDVFKQLSIPENHLGLVLVNGRKASLEKKLHEGDRVSVYPLVAGG